ncbi:MAG: hypothetical protein ACYC91_11320 [Solirubrobacteraceae bacterium]
MANATGTVLHAGRRVAVASAEAHDADGKAVLVATGSALLAGGSAALVG